MDSFEAGEAEDTNMATYIHEQFNSFFLDKVWNDEHYIKLQIRGRYVNKEMQISFLYIAWISIATSKHRISAEIVSQLYLFKADLI